MKGIVLAILLALSITACTKTASEKIVLSGKYVGTFERIKGAGEKEMSNVSITFTGTGFTGESDKATFPAICNGSYSGEGSDIHFTNRCAWIAAFDWTLVLSDDYSFNAGGDSVEIRRTYARNITDIYRLRRDEK